MSNESAIERLENILKRVREYPTYFGDYDVLTQEEAQEAEDAGGDIAFITIDIGWELKKAIDELKGRE
jgi:hypothetical protein